MNAQRTLFANSVNVNKKDCTVSVIAAAIGVSQPYMSDILNGKKQPSIKVAKRMAEYFNMHQAKLYILLGWIDDDSQSDLLKFIDNLPIRDHSSRPTPLNLLQK